MNSHMLCEVNEKVCLLILELSSTIADKEQEQEIDFGFNKGLDNTFVDGGSRKLTNLK